MEPTKDASMSDADFTQHINITQEQNTLGASKATTAGYSASLVHIKLARKDHEAGIAETSKAPAIFSLDSKDVNPKLKRRITED